MVFIVQIWVWMESFSMITCAGPIVELPLPKSARTFLEMVETFPIPVVL